MKKQLEPRGSHEQLPDDGIKHLLIEVGMGMEKINGKAWTAHPIHNFAMETEARKGQKHTANQNSVAVCLSQSGNPSEALP